MRKLCLGTNPQFGIGDMEQIDLFCKVGFDGVFANWEEDLDVAAFARRTKERGLFFQSVHAPFRDIHLVWELEAEPAAQAMATLQRCLEDCARVEVPLMVLHAYKGFDKHTPTDIGIMRLAPLVSAAEKYGVKLGFENTEGEEYLEAVMTAFADSEAVGFCWDTGHELCYNSGKDQLEKYGTRLLGTHFNDNLGISDPGGKIFWTDDLHLLPFDGIADWKDIAVRLQKAGFAGPLTFELNTKSKPNRHENDAYAAKPIEEYLALALSRARRFAALFAE